MEKWFNNWRRCPYRNKISVENVAMRFILYICFFLFFGVGAVFAQNAAYNIIPKPAKLTPREGQFVFSAQTRIVAPIMEPHVFNAVFVLLERLLLNTQFNTQIVDNSNGDIAPDKDMIFCRINPDIGMEAYKMSIYAERIEIEAGSATGIFYAVQTIRQMLPAAIERNRLAGDATIAVPCAVIEDEPRYPFRGMMLDVARHFADASAVRRYIDLLAYHKINHFHWHLTNDQGWRIEIDKYPNLTQKGAWRDSTLIGAQTDDETAERSYLKQRHGGFYTKEQVRNIVAYAQRRFVTIIPEISMPGHSLAALAAYPELSCTGSELAVASHWGKFDDVLCTKDQTFEFIENVITEIIELFPGEYIHIGADDFSTIRWENCDHCRAKIEELGLENAHELKDYFIERIEKFVATKGKRLLTRDDMPNLNFAVCQTQSREREPLCADGYLPTAEVYDFELAPEQIAETPDTSLTGAQANLWREYITSDMQTEATLLPRLAAFAETLWTPENEKNYDDFLVRLAEILKRYEAMNFVSSRP